MTETTIYTDRYGAPATSSPRYVITYATVYEQRRMRLCSAHKDDDREGKRGQILHGEHWGICDICEHEAHVAAGEDGAGAAPAERA